MSTTPQPGKAGRKYPLSFGFLFALLERRRVSSLEIELVLPTFQNDWLRPEVLAKLATLDLENEVQADLHRRATLVLELFDAVETGRYRRPREWDELSPWLSRALAYFTKNGDAIPDYFEDGFEDDHREFVGLGEKAGLLLDHFEAWWKGQLPMPGTAAGDAANPGK